MVIDMFLSCHLIDICCTLASNILHHVFYQDKVRAEKVTFQMFFTTDYKILTLKINE